MSKTQTFADTLFKTSKDVFHFIQSILFSQIFDFSWPVCLVLSSQGATERCLTVRSESAHLH